MYGVADVPIWRSAGLIRAKLQVLVCIWIYHHHPTSTDDIVRWEGERSLSIYRKNLAKREEIRGYLVCKMKMANLIKTET